jgi:hypothetical protein
MVTRADIEKEADFINGLIKRAEMNKKLEPIIFLEGMRVAKVGGDYAFAGTVCSAFRKKNGAPRYVVENDAGLLHIFHGAQLMKEPS